MKGCVLIIAICIIADYALSPQIVKMFGDTKWFKHIWKGTIDKMVSDLQKKGVESTPYDDREW